MATAAIEITPRIRVRSEHPDMLRNLDERVQAIELSWEYASRLGNDEWLALKDVAGRNEIPLHIT